MVIDDISNMGTGYYDCNTSPSHILMYCIYNISQLYILYITIYICRSQLYAYYILSHNIFINWTVLPSTRCPLTGSSCQNWEPGTRPSLWIQLSLYHQTLTKADNFWCQKVAPAIFGLHFPRFSEIFQGDFPRSIFLTHGILIRLLITSEFISENLIHINQTPSKHWPIMTHCGIFLWLFTYRPIAHICHIYMICHICSYQYMAQCHCTAGMKLWSEPGIPDTEACADHFEHWNLRKRMVTLESSKDSYIIKRFW